MFIGYQCRPCDTQILWEPAAALKQIKREGRRHCADYRRTEHDALHRLDTKRMKRMGQ